MRRWIGLVAGFYPRGWREEFGPEFEALLEDVRPSWRVFRNVLGGAIRMQISEGGNWMKLAGAMAVVGALVAFAFSFRVAPQYVSSAVMSVTPQADPVRSTSAEALHQHAAADVSGIESVMLSRVSLAQIIMDPRLDLYHEERRRMPLEDVIQLMRSDIRIQIVSSTGGDLAPIVFDISFSYPDQAKAQATVRALTSKFAEESVQANRLRTEAYQGFWQDFSQFTHGKPAPPPPVGEVVGVLNAASLAVEAGPKRAVFLAWGLGAGLVLGLLAAFALRRPRGIRRLFGWALAGAVVACGISFVIPNRFTSTAAMEIVPPELTEDPAAPLPPATPAAEYLRQMEPDVLSVENLSRIIQDRRLNLYADERAKMPMDEVVRKMIDDLSIVPVNSAFETQGSVSAFRILFTYRDRYKAQQTVNALMNTIEEQRQNQMKANASKMSFAVQQITQRKAGEVLEVLDPASLPVYPVSPNRIAITLGGLCLGLLIGMARMWRQRIPAAPIPQIA